VQSTALAAAAFIEVPSAGKFPSGGKRLALIRLRRLAFCGSEHIRCQAQRINLDQRYKMNPIGLERKVIS
jgi:hypothetical protein